MKNGRPTLADLYEVNMDNSPVNTFIISFIHGITKHKLKKDK